MKKGLIKFFHKAYHFLLELIFPKFCVSCGGFGAALCKKCQAKIKPIKSSTCPKCGKLSKAGRYCQTCHRTTSLSGMIVAANYCSPVKELIYSLKYLGVFESTSILAELMSLRLSQNLPSGEIVVVPVPLYRKRKLERGFNQSELLSRLVCQKLNLSGKNALKRIKETKSQVGLSGDERRKNLVGAFVCSSPALIKGKTVILLDDVSTTGATLEESAKALRTAGAKQVWGLVVARG